jgi:hypothetical protein
MAAPSAASGRVDGLSWGLENASVAPPGQHGPLRSAAPSASTPLRSAVAHHTHPHEVSGIATGRLRRLGGKTSIPLHATRMTDGAAAQGDARQGFIALPVIRDGRRLLGRFGSGANFLKCMFLSGEGLCGF